MILRLTNITQFFNNRLIVKDVNALFNQEEITLLAGANGAGKSTLLRIMTGLLQPTQGQVTLAKHIQKNRNTIGFLGHQHFLYPELTALENLQFWNNWYGENYTKTDLEKALKRVELFSFAEEKVQGFSRGMTQRLSLARVFLQNPQLLLLDEPASGLDVRSATLLRERIVEAKKQGTTVIWITHDVPKDLPLADKVLYIENKKTLFLGSATDFAKNHPAHCYREGIMPENLQTDSALCHEDVLLKDTHTKNAQSKHIPSTQLQWAKLQQKKRERL